MSKVGVSLSNSFSLEPLPWKSLWKRSVLKINVRSRLNCVLQFVNIQFCLRISDHVMFSQRADSSKYCPIHVHMYAKLIAKGNSQHCWMLHVVSFCTPCSILLDVVAFRWAKFETCQTFNTVQTGATLVGVVASVCKKVHSRELFLSNVFLSTCISMHNLQKDKRQIPRRTSRGLL